ncbi:MAG: P-loop NTPase [Clostridiales bacterium]|nr:P-loop NTPase [Clostridiales bacterium]
MSEIIVITSGKGGVGKSTAVSEIAYSLSKQGKKVMCIDCDIVLRSLEIILGVSDRSVFHWGDIIQNRCDPSQAVINCHSGIDLLCAPADFDENTTKDAFKDMLLFFDNQYEYILIDSPAGFDTGFGIAVCAADRAIIVATPDAVSVSGAEKCAEKLRVTGLADIRLIINMFQKNKVGSNRQLNIDKCIDLTCVQLIGVVPFDREVAFSSVTDTNPGDASPFSRAYLRISQRIMGKSIPLKY